MSVFTRTELRQAEGIESIVYCNPFAPERIAAERQALGVQFAEDSAFWNGSNLSDGERPNVLAIADLVEVLCGKLRERVLAGASATPREMELYEAMVMHALYYRRHATLRPLARSVRAGRPIAGLAASYDGLVDDMGHFFDGIVAPLKVSTALSFAWPLEPAHLFACFFQIVRAFDQIFGSIVGASEPSARLRAAIWQSIFTHDMRRYRRSLFDKTGDFTTLIVGPSGTGKELVARAIGLSRYIPFDAKRKVFTENFADSFFPLNLSALSPTLVESELFGHRRGAFTGATTDRKGWLQKCPPLGSVFLDEIGELDPAIQVKLLRVLQTRTFQSLGDTDTLHFRGKIIAATNRDLQADMRSGRFRQDFYYRLCSDVITTPSLREQIADRPDELQRLIAFIAANLIPDEAGQLTEQVQEALRRHLPENYAWPGNFRELEQCVRNVLVRGTYIPPQTAVAADDDLAARITAGALTADELLSEYCGHLYRLTGSYEATGKRLQLDRRTVRAKLAGRTDLNR